MFQLRKVVLAYTSMQEMGNANQNIQTVFAYIIHNIYNYMLYNIKVIIITIIVVVIMIYTDGSKPIKIYPILPYVGR